MGSHRSTSPLSPLTSPSVSSQGTGSTQVHDLTDPEVESVQLQSGIDPFGTPFRATVYQSTQKKKKVNKRNSVTVTPAADPKNEPKTARLVSPLFGRGSSRFHLYSKPSPAEIIFHQSIRSFEAISAIQYDSSTSKLLNQKNFDQGGTPLKTVVDYHQPKLSKVHQSKLGAVMNRFDVHHWLRIVGLMSFNPIRGSPGSRTAQLQYTRMWFIAMINWVMATR